MNDAIIKQIHESNDRFNLFLLDCSNGNLKDHKLFLLSEEINIVNIGMSVAEYVGILEDYSYLSIDVFDYVKKLLDANKSIMSSFERCAVAIHNIGILMEPRLGLRPAQLLKEFSKSTALIILWEHELVYPDRLHWPTQQNNIFLDFSDAPIKILNHAV